MPKEKKISFKYFINSKLKSKDGESYPLYVQVVFNSLMTKLKPLKSLDISMTEKEFDSWEKGLTLQAELQQKLNLLKNSEDLIEKVVRHQYEKKQKFTFKGIGNLVDLYSTKIIDILEKGLLVEIQNRLEVSLTIEQYQMVMIDEAMEGIFQRLVVVAGKKEAQKIMSSLRLHQYTIAFDLYRNLVEVHAKKNSVLDALHNPLVCTISEWRFGDGRENMKKFYLNPDNWFNSEFVANNLYFEKTNLELYIELINSELLRYFKFSTGL